MSKNQRKIKYARNIYSFDLKYFVCIVNFRLSIVHVNPTIMQLTKFQWKLMILYSYFKNKAVMHLFSQPSVAALPFLFPHTGAITVVVMHD